MRARIISLGEIVTPNIMKAVGAFTALIANKISSSNPAQIGMAIGCVLQANMTLINNFKLGQIEEDAFNEQMIAALENATAVKLTPQEFDAAWNAMNPSYAQFKDILCEAIKFNNQKKQQLIFISFTNPKDIRHLINELTNNGVAYKLDGQDLIEIAGMPLLATYACHKSKAQLIEEAFNELQASQLKYGSLAASIGSVFNNDQPQSQESLDIKYIRGVNDLKDPILKQDLDNTIQQVEASANSLMIDTLLWKKYENASLSDVLNSQSTSSKAYSISVL